MADRSKTDLSRMERKKQKMKENIISASMKLFSRSGFEGTSMEAIAEEADIAKGTLYNYFPSKEAIVAEEIRMTLATEYSAWVEKLETLSDTRERMIFVLEQLLYRIRKNMEIFKIYLAYRMQKMAMLDWDWDESVKSGVYLLGHKIMELGTKSQELRSDLPQKSLEELFEFIFLGVIRQLYHDPEHFDQAAEINMAIDLFLTGAQKH